MKDCIERKSGAKALWKFRITARRAEKEHPLNLNVFIVMLFMGVSVFYIFFNAINSVTPREDNELLHDFVIFTALHGMQTRSSDENSVPTSVRPSHACIVTKRKKDLSRFLHHTKNNLA